MIGIYKITNNLNGKSYIGQSVDIKRRWNEHKRNIGSNKNPMYLDFEKYGLDNFSFEILEECEITKLDEREIYWISNYNTYKQGYNLTTGGKSNRSYIFTILPVDTINEIVDNSMQLYFYLLSLSHETENDSFFFQREISLDQIKNALHMHPDTIKKYWVLLEDRGLLKYEGPTHVNVNFKKLYAIRKKDGATYYSIPKKSPYRIIPKETLDKMQNQFLVDEQELKLYLLLAELQERFCYMSSPERIFSVADLRQMLQLKKQDKTNKAIISGLLWLKSLGLIDYKPTGNITNLGESEQSFYLTCVNYYTDGGEVNQLLNSAEGNGVLSEELKQEIISSKVVTIF